MVNYGQFLSYCVLFRDSVSLRGTIVILRPGYCTLTVFWTYFKYGIEFAINNWTKIFSNDMRLRVYFRLWTLQSNSRTPRSIRSRQSRISMTSSIFLTYDLTSDLNVGNWNFLSLKHLYVYQSKDSAAGRELLREFSLLRYLFTGSKNVCELSWTNNFYGNEIGLKMMIDSPK